MQCKFEVMLVLQCELYDVSCNLQVRDHVMQCEFIVVLALLCYIM